MALEEGKKLNVAGRIKKDDIGVKKIDWREVEQYIIFLPYPVNRRTDRKGPNAMYMMMILMIPLDNNLSKNDQLLYFHFQSITFQFLSWLDTIGP